MERETIEISVAKDIPPEEVEERRKTFMHLMGKAFVNSAKEAMKKEREVSASANDN